MDDNGDGLLADPPDQLRPFIRDGRITALPAKRDRRLLLLDQVAQAFEPGRRGLPVPDRGWCLLAGRRHGQLAARH
jgi:hypothetical protein